MEYESQRRMSKHPVDTEEQFKEFCLNNTYLESNSVTGENYEYNYYNLSKSLNNAINEFNDSKTVLLLQMREFIDESIKPIER
jgi:hypothetical protein